MICNVDDQEFERFFAGQRDDLIDHVGECERCQERMENALGDRASDVTEQTMRAVRIDFSTREVAATVIDVGSRFGRALITYLVRNGT